MIESFILVLFHLEQGVLFHERKGISCIQHKESIDELLQSSISLHRVVPVFRLVLNII